MKITRIENACYFFIYSHFKYFSKNIPYIIEKTAIIKPVLKIMMLASKRYMEIKYVLKSHKINVPEDEIIKEISK